ncbi:Enterobactin synthase component E [Klebsiella pneumoniae]|nr:Enterobactin synthase component E [Klebsiella pneumoniae]
MTRGPYTFRGYYNSPQHNAEAFDADGFYCSGDLISIDEDGYITVRAGKRSINRAAARRSPLKRSKTCCCAMRR